MEYLVRERSIFVVQDVDLNIGESIMTKAEFYNEYNYQEIKKILKKLLNDRIISKSEFYSILLIFKEKYKPIFDMITD